MPDNKEPTRFVGKYRGIVTDIKDPLMLGRIKARVPDVYGELESGWALPCAPFAGSGTGVCGLPTPGAWVWIEFEQGDPDWPIWSGGFWQPPKMAPAGVYAPPYNKVVIQTAGGNQILLDDTPGAGGITLKTATGHQIVLAAEGITLKTATGQKIAIAASGIEINNGQGGAIKMTGPKVDVNSGALEVI